MHVELCLCRVLIHDYKGTSFHGIYLSNLQKISCIILRNLSGLSLFFFICHVPPAHSFFEKRSILESILLILFSCSYMAGFLYHIRHGDLQVSRNGAIGRRRERFREVSRTMMMTTRRKAFFISHVPPAHSFFEKRTILEGILLILFSCSSMAGFLYLIRHGDLQVSRNGAIGRRRERFREVSRTMMMTTRRKA